MRELETNCPNIQDEYGGKIIFPFGPCIYQNFISDELRKSLLEEGGRIRNKDHDYGKRLAGNMYFGGSYDYGNEYKVKVFPEFLKILFQWFDFMVYHYDGGRVNFAPGKEDLEVNLDTLWINFQRRYDHNPPHQHHGIVSFVVYLDVPQGIFDEQADSNVKDAGKIVFKYGESISPLSVNGWNVTPEDNLILMFPATLNHMVHPFWIDEERISVSGNFTLTDRIVISQNGA